LLLANKSYRYFVAFVPEAYQRRDDSHLGGEYEERNEGKLVDGGLFLFDPVIFLDRARCGGAGSEF
jgi:hypothetical protein